MNDIETAFARLRGEAERRNLPVAEQIRRNSDRRARRTAVGALAAVVLGTVAAVGVLPLVHRQAAAPAGPAVTPASSPSPSPSPSPSVAPEPSPGSDCLDRYPAQIPAGVFLTEVTADNTICYAPPSPAAGEPRPQPVLPTICARPSHASDALIADRRGVNVMFSYEDSTTPRVYAHTVTKYRGTGAQSYLAELRQAAQRCGGYLDGGVKYEYAIVSAARLGDDSIRLRLRRTFQQAEPDLVPRSATFFISVVRKDSYVSVVFDQGWEGRPSRSTAIFDVMRQAAGRLPA